jgi:ribosomal protein S18 acetylase RimI-like enzyme
MRLRLATRHDLDQIVDIFNTSRNDPRDGMEVEYRKHDFAAYLDATHCLLVVAYEPAIIGASGLDYEFLATERILGFCLAYDLVTWGFVDILCVRPEARKMGIGSELLHWIEDLYDHRWGAIELCYNGYDPQLHQFVRKHGYGEPEDLVWVSKKLTPREN